MNIQDSPDNQSSCFEANKIQKCPYLNDPKKQKEKPKQTSSEDSKRLGPASLDYFRLHKEDDPQKLADLVDQTFDTEKEVTLAVQNLSLIERKNFYKEKGGEPGEKRVIFKCNNCNFLMKWNKNEAGKLVLEQFTDHTCDSEIPRVHHQIIDEIIIRDNLYHWDKEDAIKHIRFMIGDDVENRNIINRLKVLNESLDDNYFWQIIPSFLENNEKKWRIIAS